MLTDFKASPRRDLMVGIGSALMDICIQESESFLDTSGAKKGGMTLVDGRRIPELLEKTGQKPFLVPGGSACNTTIGIAQLGNKSRFIGKNGNDEWGTLFETGLRQQNVEPVLSSSSTPTGHVLSIITPDAQRSMLTFLGASAQMDPAEINAGLFRNAALVHVEGYMLFNRDLMLAVLESAKKAGARISLDLASYTVVEQAGEFLRNAIKKYIDIVIANEDEARVFTGHSDGEKACRAISALAELAVVKLGARGSLIAYKDEVTYVKASGNGAPVKDTTGAGDLWASGFLFGLLQGFPIEKCGALGSACGFEVCNVIGASIPAEGWKRIRKLI